MPTYVYECAKCGDELEVWQSIADDPLKRHTGSCGGKLAKVIQPAGIVLKGSGFYKNDSRTSAKRSTRTSPDSASSDATSSDSASSDSSSGSDGGSTSSSSDGSTGNGATSVRAKQDGAKKPSSDNGSSKKPSPAKTPS